MDSPVPVPIRLSVFYPLPRRPLPAFLGDLPDAARRVLSRKSWPTTTQTKTLLFDQAAERFRAGEALVRDGETQRPAVGPGAGRAVPV
jgi:hypothetical protein